MTDVLKTFTKYDIKLEDMYANAEDCAGQHPFGDAAPMVNQIDDGTGGPGGYPYCFFNIPLCEVGSRTWGLDVLDKPGKYPGTGCAPPTSPHTGAK